MGSLGNFLNPNTPVNYRLGQADRVWDSLLISIILLHFPFRISSQNQFSIIDEGNSSPVHLIFLSHGCPYNSFLISFADDLRELQTLSHLQCQQTRHNFSSCWFLCISSFYPCPPKSSPISFLIREALTVFPWSPMPPSKLTFIHPFWGAFHYWGWIDFFTPRILL